MVEPRHALAACGNKLAWSLCTTLGAKEKVHAIAVLQKRSVLVYRRRRQGQKSEIERFLQFSVSYTSRTKQRTKQGSRLYRSPRIEVSFCAFNSTPDHESEELLAPLLSLPLFSFCLASPSRQSSSFPRAC